MSGYERYFTPEEEDYREVVKNHNHEAREQRKKQALVDSLEDSYDNDDDYDDSCPICASIKCGGYCL